MRNHHCQSPCDFRQARLAPNRSGVEFHSENTGRPAFSLAQNGKRTDRIALWLVVRPIPSTLPIGSPVPSLNCVSSVQNPLPYAAAAVSISVGEQLAGVPVCALRSRRTVTIPPPDDALCDRSRYLTRIGQSVNL